MNLNRITVPAILLYLGIAAVVTPRAHGIAQGSPQQGYGQDRDNWGAPPNGWNDIQRRGFQDGMDGARRDFDNHRQPDVDNRDEYRHPNLQPDLWAPYREGFRRGYDVAMSRLMGGRDWRMRAPNRPWDAPPNDFSNEIARRGFQDGVEGARKDVDNHRRPDVNNRDEYRHPDVQPDMRGIYQQGFARGYQTAMSHLMGGPGMQVALPVLAWDAPDPGWDDMQRRGFRDGMDGARKDYDNHRRPDVNNRDEYRHPSVPREARQTYREGFQRGYDRAMSHLMGGRDHDHDHDRY